MSNLAQFDQLKANITLKVTPALSLKVSDTESQHNALAAGREIKDFAKRIEETRKALVKPLNEQVKAINDYAKTLSEPIDKVEAHIKKELVAFEKELEKVRAEAARNAEKERKEKEAEAARIAEEKRQEAEMKSMFSEPEEAQREEIVAKVEEERVQAEIAQEHKAVVRGIAANKVSGIRKTWTFKITDESLVPRQFLSVDEKKIRAQIKEAIEEGWIGKEGEDYNYPGIEFFQETSMALR